MALIDELKEKRAKAAAERVGALSEIGRQRQTVGNAEMYLADLDKAISALSEGEGGLLANQQGPSQESNAQASETPGLDMLVTAISADESPGGSVQERMGFDARARGQSRDDCPFKEEGVGRGLWMLGYTNAELYFGRCVACGNQWRDGSMHEDCGRQNAEASQVVSELDSQVQADGDRVEQTNTDTVAAVEIPEGFIPWESGYCPFGIGTHVEVLTRKNGVWPVVIKPEAPLLWEHEGHDLDIIAYKVISEPAKASEAPSELKTQAEVGGDRVAPHDLPALSDEAFNALPKLDDTAVIDAEPPTIPRSEIPEGVAVETFTEQGVETVKIGGLTHIVEGEAPVDKFSAIRDGGDAGFWAAARGLTKIEEMA